MSIRCSLETKWTLLDELIVQGVLNDDIVRLQDNQRQGGISRNSGATSSKIMIVLSARCCNNLADWYCEE